MEAMSATFRTNASNATTGVPSRAGVAAYTGWYGPAIDVFVIAHKHPDRRPPL